MRLKATIALKLNSPIKNVMKAGAMFLCLWDLKEIRRVQRRQAEQKPLTASLNIEQALGRFDDTDNRVLFRCRSVR